MTDGAKAPWHLWVVGVLALLFNAGGGYDYLMHQTENAAYREMLTPEMVSYYDNFPFWMEAAWGVSVWFAIGGALLLLLRRKIAAPLFLVSFAAYLVTGTYTYFLSTPPEGVISAGPNIFAFVIGLQIVLLWFYSRAMTRRGVLR